MNIINRFSLKLIIRSFFWIYGTFKVLILLSLIYIYFGPGFLDAAQTLHFSFERLYLIVLNNIIEFIILILLFSYLYRHKYIFPNQDRFLRTIFIFIYILGLITAINFQYTEDGKISALVIIDLMIASIFVFVLSSPQKIMELSNNQIK